jgi:hypothetical protein
MDGLVSPRGDKLVYPQDKDGNETHHLFLLPTKGGEANGSQKIPIERWKRIGIQMGKNSLELLLPWSLVV